MKLLQLFAPFRNPAVYPQYNLIMSSASQFSIYIGFGAIIGLCWSWWLVKQNNPHRFSTLRLEKYLEGMLLTALMILFGALLGSRISFVWLHWAYFNQHNSEIWQIWAGGLDWTGALWGAAILVFLFNGLRDQTPRVVLNDLLPFFTWLITALWMSSLVSHTYYGAVHSPAWWTLSVVDQTGEYLPRVPIHLLAAGVTVASGVFLDGQSRWWLKSLRLEWFLFIQLILLIGMSFLRADPVASLLHLPVDRFFGVVYLAAIAFSISLKIKQELKKPQMI